MPQSPTSRAIRNFAGVKNEPAKLVRAHLDKLPQVRNIPAVLDWLDQSAVAFGLQLHGIWELPNDFKNQLERWNTNRNIFLSRKAPKSFWPQYKEQHRIHGPSAMAVMARHTNEPFTFIEAEREAKRRRWRNLYVFDLFRRHGAHDGLYVTSRRWAACFVSRTQVVMGPHERMFIQGVSMKTFGRVEQLKAAPMSYRKSNHSFTTREKDVMQRRVLDGSAEKAAAKLNISAKTFAVHLQNARKKLGTDDTVQLLLTAFKDGVIDY